MGNEIKIVIGGDASSLVQANNQANASVEALQKTIVTASVKIDTATDAIRHSFDEVAAGKAAMDRITESINAAAAEATKAGPKFDSLGGRLPLDDFNKFRGSVDQFKRDIARGFKFNFPPNPIPPAVPAAFDKTKIGANQAASALTNVGRVAQDLPFGFVGIQNNLNPLLESFQRLKAETGSGKAALSALGQSLIGPAGLGIALSVVSSAIVIFQNGIAGFNSKTKEAKDKTEDFLKTLKSVGEVTAAATGSQAGNIAEIQALANVVQDTNAAYAQRKNALEQLQQTNKSYFGDITLEESQMGKLKDRVNEYTQALVAQAVVKGFTDEIGRVSVELAKQERILSGNTDEVNRLRTALEFTKKSETSLTGEDRISQKYINTKDALDDANDAFSDQAKVVLKLRANYDDLSAEIQNAVNNTTKLKLLNDPGAGKKEEDALKKRLEALEKIKDSLKDATQLVGIQEAIFDLQVKIAIRDQGKNKLSASELQQQIKGFQDELNEAFKKQAIELEAIPKVRFSQVVLADTTQKDISSVIAKATGFDKKITIPTQFEIEAKINGKEFAEQAEIARNQVAAVIASLANGIQNAIIQGSEIIGEAFGSLLSGEGIGNALAKAAQGLLGIIGGILQDVGKQIIITSGLVAALKKALQGLFGPGGEVIGLAVGAALIATGALLKNIKFDVPKLAEGGIATRATLGIFGEAGKEAIIPLDRLPELLGRVNVNSQNDIALAPTFRVSLTDLELGLERVRSKRRRLG